MARKLWHKLQKITEKSSRAWNIIMCKIVDEFGAEQLASL